MGFMWAWLELGLMSWNRMCAVPQVLEAGLNVIYKLPVQRREMLWAIQYFGQQVL